MSPNNEQYVPTPFYQVEDVINPQTDQELADYCYTFDQAARHLATLRFFERQAFDGGKDGIDFNRHLALHLMQTLPNGREYIAEERKAASGVVKLCSVVLLQIIRNEEHPFNEEFNKMLSNAAEHIQLAMLKDVPEEGRDLESLQQAVGVSYARQLLLGLNRQRIEPRQVVAEREAWMGQ